MSPSSLIFIVGPTAVGKSAIALFSAPRLNAEIISCDAMQVYQEIQIANDKPDGEARSKVTHHLLDILSVTEEFNVARFRALVLPLIKDIHARWKMPLIVGGSGMYMSVLLDGIFEGNDQTQDSASIRQVLTEEMQQKGIAVLHDRLKTLDPSAAAKIHPNDPQRIIRALEVVMLTGKPISQQQKKREGLWGTMPIKIVGLNRPRQELYDRAEKRIDEMFSRGLVDEITSIAQMPLSQTARKIIGVPEVLGYLYGEYDLERAKYLMKLNTRHYIKRQLTWFRRDKRIEWIDIKEDQDEESIVKLITQVL